MGGNGERGKGGKKEKLRKREEKEEKEKGEKWIGGERRREKCERVRRECRDEERDER